MIRQQVLPILMVLIGIALIVRSVLIGAWIGILIGLLFIGAGVGRMYLERSR